VIFVRASAGQHATICGLARHLFGVSAARYFQHRRTIVALHRHPLLPKGRKLGPMHVQHYVGVNEYKVFVTVEVFASPYYGLHPQLCINGSMMAMSCCGAKINEARALVCFG